MFFISTKAAKCLQVSDSHLSGVCVCGSSWTARVCIHRLVFPFSPKLPSPVSPVRILPPLSSSTSTRLCFRLFQTVCLPRAGGSCERDCCLGFWPVSCCLFWWSSSDRLYETRLLTHAEQSRAYLLVCASWSGKQIQCKFRPLFYHFCWNFYFFHLEITDWVIKLLLPSVGTLICCSKLTGNHYNQVGLWVNLKLIQRFCISPKSLICMRKITGDFIFTSFFFCAPLQDWWKYLLRRHRNT